MTQLVCNPRTHVGPLEVRRKGMSHAQHQCQACLCGTGRRIPRAEFTSAGWQGLLGWGHQRAARKASQNSRARKARDFYRSPEWIAMRAAKLEQVRQRQGGPFAMCEGEGCDQPAVTAHHVRYGKVLAETPMSDLRASCASCNANEKIQRIGGGGRVHQGLA